MSLSPSEEGVVTSRVVWRRRTENKDDAVRRYGGRSAGVHQVTPHPRKDRGGNDPRSGASVISALDSRIKQWYHVGQDVVHTPRYKGISQADAPPH